MKKWLQDRKGIIPFVCAIVFGEALPFFGRENLIKDGWGIYTTQVLVAAAVLAIATELVAFRKK